MALPPGPPPGLCRGPAGGFKAPHRPKAARSMTYDHCFRAFGTIPYTSTFYLYPAVPPTFPAVPTSLIILKSGTLFWDTV